MINQKQSMKPLLIVSEPKSNNEQNLSLQKEKFNTYEESQLSISPLKSTEMFTEPYTKYNSSGQTKKFYSNIGCFVRPKSTPINFLDTNKKLNEFNEISESETKIPSQKIKYANRQNEQLYDSSNRNNPNQQQYQRHFSIISPNNLLNLEQYNQKSSPSIKPLSNLGSINTFLKKRRKSSEFNDEKLNQYIKKYHDIPMIINMHEKKQKLVLNKEEELKNMQLFSQLQKKNVDFKNINPNNIQSQLKKQRRSMLFNSEYIYLQQLNNKIDINKTLTQVLDIAEYTPVRNKSKTNSYITPELPQNLNQQSPSEKAIDNSNFTDSLYYDDNEQSQTNKQNQNLFPGLAFHKNSRKILDNTNSANVFLKKYKNNRFLETQNILPLSLKPQLSEKSLLTYIQSPLITDKSIQQLELQQTQSLERVSHMKKYQKQLQFQSNISNQYDSSNSKYLSQYQKKQKIQDQLPRFDSTSISIKSKDNSIRLIKKNHQSVDYQSNYQVNNNFLSSQPENLKEFANRYIQNFSLIDPIMKRDIQKDKINPTSAQATMLSKIFQSRSKIKQSEKILVKSPLNLSMIFDGNKNNNDKNQKETTQKIQKYTTYLQNKSYIQVKKQQLFQNYKINQTGLNINTNSINQSFDLIRLSTEGSSPKNQKINLIQKTII